MHKNPLPMRETSVEFCLVKAGLFLSPRPVGWNHANRVNLRGFFFRRGRGFTPVGPAEECSRIKVRLRLAIAAGRNTFSSGRAGVGPRQPFAR
jgi:hypothetical protein